ncbi:hypothetical protein SLE2022_184430 [Rubroshorea leprosula]
MQNPPLLRRTTQTNVESHILVPGALPAASMRDSSPDLPLQPAPFSSAMMISRSTRTQSNSASEDGGRIQTVSSAFRAITQRRLTKEGVDSHGASRQVLDRADQVHDDEDRVPPEVQLRRRSGDGRKCDGSSTRKITARTY